MHSPAVSMVEEVSLATVIYCRKVEDVWVNLVGLSAVSSSNTALNWKLVLTQIVCHDRQLGGL